MRMMLDHSVGVPAFRGELAPDFMIHWDQVVERLAAEAPFWEPGTRNGYHLINFGWTVGELVRRVSGKSLGTFFREAICDPLGLDFWIGLPEEHEPRVSNLIQAPPPEADRSRQQVHASDHERTGVGDAGRDGEHAVAEDVGPRMARRRDRWRRRHHATPAASPACTRRSRSAAAD